ncbi:hypothetical protein BDB00DRAFT_854740 [Zychaea mexicana]|uniref:uncharacterized protein n=1 Tax=Zychaea mexicana TaxID=64656 RepID=UPI0022FE247D|nr:uncharacterized protein BDB00DRAFT_854740 [Zychaea mexicana]KAI9484564.1 hypothetical protein BDB00DRAFT_854740 [Zychaea mexicana]
MTTDGATRSASTLHPSPSSTSAQSMNSTSSQTPLNRQADDGGESSSRRAIPEENTTYFLLDINDGDNNNNNIVKDNNDVDCDDATANDAEQLQQQQRRRRGRSGSNSRRSVTRSTSCSSSSSSSSSGSSVSAQVVIDHGNSLPRRLDKRIARRLVRSDNEESESDYAYSYTPRPEAGGAEENVTHPCSQGEDAEGATQPVSPTDREDDGIHHHHHRQHHHHHHHQRKLDNSTHEGKPPQGMTVYTEEDDELMEEVPSWGDHERIRRHEEDEEEGLQENSPYDGGDEGRAQRHHHQRKPKKRINRLRQEDLHSHSWSRRESQQNVRRSGLTSEEALQKLLFVANQILEEKRTQIAKKISVMDWLLRPWTLLGLLTGFALLVFYIAGYFVSDPYQFRLTGALVESLLVLAMVGWNGFLYQREQKMTLYEMINRATTIIEALDRSGMNMVQDTRIPFIPNMSVARVVRDGVVRIFPVNLLVEGDVVEMLYGDVAPGRMKYIHKPGGSVNDSDSQQQQQHAEISSKEEGYPLQTREYYLAKDQIFKSSFFGIPPPMGLMDEYLRARGRHQFLLLETPLEKNMRTALVQKRPDTVLTEEARKLERVFYHYIVWIVIGIEFVINLLRFGLRDKLVNGFATDQLLELMTVIPFYSILPLLPFCLPSLWLVARSFGNAQLLILFEALQISKTEYEDDDEDDEFDTEAPPPTKDVELSPNVVWDRFCSLLIKRDRLSLTRSINLLESLGSTTVICCLDREGTIANPFPTVEQLMFPDKEDIRYLDVTEDSDEEYGLKFEDQDWEQYLASLKPVGLNFMLNTNCGVLQGRKRSEYHRRRSKLHVYGRTSPARQTCLCRLGKCIGFKEEALDSFALRAEIYTFAPYHEMLSAARYEYSQYYQFEVPNALSTVFEEKTSGSYQLLTDGHPSLVLDKCSDYWDGNGLQTMCHTMEKKVSDFFQNAMVHDMQCIAYAYRPINTTHGHRIPFLNPIVEDAEEPGCAFVVLPFKPPSSDSSSTASSSSSSSSSQNSVNETAPQTGSPSLSFTGIPLSIESGAEAEPSSLPKKHRRRSSKTTAESSGSESTSDYSFEEDEPVDEQEEEMFYKEVVKGQIFLGMTAMCHQPKQNVVDFIEDLGLAGIRFVNFSPTAERESKAFAERLGLETDWNSCILLSSPDDENCGNGYLQSHDIKAQLPRGIDQIRHHLEDVDDIPLHVSLFAECTPRAIKEMIRIFQEYGEVVCCIGNALNAKNTESFALADMSIAMEPMHTRAQTKGRLSLSGRQPPLAVGASLVSLPCGLFMQYETSLYAVTQMIRDARRLMSCIRMGFAFYVGTCMSLTLMQILCSCMLLPSPITGYQILWIMWIILPILSLSMLFTPHDDNIMLLMPGKNIEHLTGLVRFMVYFLLRFLPLIIICIIIYTMTLIYSLGIPASQAFGGLGSSDRGGWLHWTREEQWAVLYAQNLMLISFVWCLAWMSPSFLHRTFSLYHSIPFKNKVWVGAFFIVIALQFVFCAVSLVHGPFQLASIPWYVYFLGLIWPVIAVPVQELVKMHDDKEFTRFQKRSKLEFSTKLGMHSPL